MIKMFDDFYFGKEIADDIRSKYGVCLNPEQNDDKSAWEGKKLKLGKGGTITIGELKSDKGQQGLIFECVSRKYRSHVVKIYKRGFATAFIRDKLAKLVQFENKCENVLWPLDIVFNEDGVFCGYIMKKISFFKNLSDLNYIQKSNPLQLFDDYEGFTRTTQVKMIIELLETYKYLHDHNILIADVKLQNVVFNPETFEIYICDTDSFQVDEYGCESASLGYEHPVFLTYMNPDDYNHKIQQEGSNQMLYESLFIYTERYRMPRNDNFAIAVLIYEFLMFYFNPYDFSVYGDYPTDDQGLYDPNLGMNFTRDHTVRAEFPYSSVQEECREEAEYNAVMWSHLPSFIKELFTRAFRKQEDIKIETWLKAFKRYKEIIDDGRLEAADELFNFPILDNSDPEHFIDFDKVEFPLDSEILVTSFNLAHAIYRCMEKMQLIDDSETASKRAYMIAEKLSHKRGTFKAKFNEGNYKFSLIFNTGVIKKVKIEELD